ncbi:MAG TPA: type II CRISPR RNA-guided endonuclease Cas9, partial [Bryobacteraceae bacterium]
QFRILSFANNLRLRLEDGSERKLTPNERAILLDLTEKSEKLSLVAARRALGIKHLKFTIEEGGEKNVPVNITAVRLRCALGAIWDQLTPEQRDDLVEDAGDGKRCKTDEDMERCGLEKWRLPPEIAKRLPDVHLPAGYARYSAKALKEVVPGLELGLSVEEVIRGHPLYREARQQREPLDLLPKVTDVIPEIRNPAVLRALTELRKAVNAIIRRYRKPESIRIELARDLKKSRNERQRETGRNREREKLRELAKKELAAQDPIRWQDPRRTDIEKYLLAMEAKWRCPYTGAEYGFTDVFGDHPTVDIEHIVPRSRSLDDSFLNKTLTFRSTNIEKGNDTPREWLFESNPERYDHMVRIVKDFDPRFEVGKKLKRFAMDVSDPESLLREFVERQLQETRYASKLASRYLGVLYGGICDAQGERRVFACAGQATAKLREAWDLNAILNPERKPKKSRDDHRHHAIDALTVALSSESLIKQLADAAGDADHRFRRKIVMPVPWNGFAQQAREKVESINVSHRPARRLSGPLHEETFYSRPRIVAPANGKGKPKRYVHYRVPVTSLDSAKKFGDIVDSRVSAAVEAKAEELGGGGNKFLNNWPVLITHKGDRVLIKRVRIRKVETVVCLGKNGRERYVISGSNHHAEVVARLDSHGRIVGFECKTVTLIEALERKRQGVDVVQRNHGPGFQFICTLSEGDLVQVKRSADSPDPSIWRVRSVRQTGQLDLTPATDARLKADADLWSPTVASLFKKGGRKVLVTHLGEVTPAND